MASGGQCTRVDGLLLAERGADAARGVLEVARREWSCSARMAWILRDLSGFFGIFRDFSVFLWILRDSSGFFGISRHFSGFFGILRDLSGFFGISGDFSVFFRIFRDSSVFLRISRDSSVFFRIFGIFVWVGELTKCIHIFLKRIVLRKSVTSLER